MAIWRLYIIPGVFLIAFNTPVLGRTLMIEYARLKRTDMVTKTCPKSIIKESELSGCTAPGPRITTLDKSLSGKKTDTIMYP